MQELRLVAVSEDGTYAVLAVPGRGGRFSLPIDDRLRTVARGQFSRLAQYEIEVENPLRPKEIQDRIRAGETAEEIADVAGIPIDRVRRFEGPVLAEREYRAQEAQRSTVRGHTESGPGPRLGEVVLERLAETDTAADALAWDSRKRPDGNWQVRLQFVLDGRPQNAEWVFDTRRRHVIPADDLARRLCLPQADWPAGKLAGLSPASATVTPIGSRLSGQHAEARSEPERLAARGSHAAPVAATSAGGRAAGPPSAQHRPPPETARPHDTAPGRDAGPGRDIASARETPPARQRMPDRDAGSHEPAQGRTAEMARPAAADSEGGPAQRPVTADGSEQPDAAGQQRSARPGKKAAGRGRRSSVPSWDEIMLGNARQPD